MSYAHNILKISWGGTIYGNSDIWSNSVNAGFEDQDFDNGFDIFQYQVLVNDMAPKIQAWFSGNTSRISNKALLKWVKIAVIGTDGKYVKGPWLYDFPGNGSPGKLEMFVAPQLSVAVSFETDVQRGPGRFGRIYPPLTGFANSAGIDADGDAHADNALTLLQGLNGSLDEAFPGLTGKPKCIIASKVGAGKNAYITKIRVGQVIDTMRSRRNAFKEIYTERDLT